MRPTVRGGRGDEARGTATPTGRLSPRGRLPRGCARCRSSAEAAAAGGADAAAGALRTGAAAGGTLRGTAAPLERVAAGGTLRAAEGSDLAGTDAEGEAPAGVARFRSPCPEAVPFAVRSGARRAGACAVRAAGGGADSRARPGAACRVCGGDASRARGGAAARARGGDAFRAGGLFLGTAVRGAAACPPCCGCAPSGRRCRACCADASGTVSSNVTAAIRYRERIREDSATVLPSGSDRFQHEIARPLGRWSHLSSAAVTVSGQRRRLTRDAEPLEHRIYWPL